MCLVFMEQIFIVKTTPFEPMTVQRHFKHYLCQIHHCLMAVCL